MSTNCSKCSHKELDHEDYGDFIVCNICGCRRWINIVGGGGGGSGGIS